MPLDLLNLVLVAAGRDPLVQGGHPRLGFALQFSVAHREIFRENSFAICTILLTT